MADCSKGKPGKSINKASYILDSEATEKESDRKHLSIQDQSTIWESGQGTSPTLQGKAAGNVMGRQTEKGSGTPSWNKRPPWVLQLPRVLGKSDFKRLCPFTIKNQTKTTNKTLGTNKSWHLGKISSESCRSAKGVGMGPPLKLPFNLTVIFRIIVLNANIILLTFSEPSACFANICTLYIFCTYCYIYNTAVNISLFAMRKVLTFLLAWFLNLGLNLFFLNL